jgi:hypothetical protein
MWRSSITIEQQQSLARAFDLAWDYITAQRELAGTLDQDAVRFIANAIVHHAESGCTEESVLANHAIDLFRKRVALFSAA